MTLWAIVPVKPLRRGKSKLAGTLSEDERAELNRILLEHTIQTLSELKRNRTSFGGQPRTHQPLRSRAISERVPFKKMTALRV